MTTLIKVSVTAEHIVHGIAGSCTGCPVALAITTATGSHAAGAAPHQLWWDNGWKHAITPRRVRQWMRTFDHGGAQAVQPFTFFLRHE